MQPSSTQSTASASVEVRDALDRRIALTAPPTRIVSLVPSLTEALFAFGLRDEIVGVTKYCVEPAARVAAVAKVGGTKNPDLGAIERLRPDLVIASAEENLREHVEHLIGRGLDVYVSLPATVRRALQELRDLASLVGRDHGAEPWLAQAERRLAELERRRARVRPVRYFCPIWRRPYMIARADTYMSDLLRVCGGTSVCDAGPARYYPVELDDVMTRAPEIVLLPSEPYPFGERHRQEILRHPHGAHIGDARVRLVDGQLLTWYGPRIAAALDSFALLFQEVAVDR